MDRSKTNNYINIMYLVIFVSVIVFIIIPKTSSSYADEYNADGQIEIAKWSFDVGVGSASSNEIDLIETIADESPYHSLVPESFGQFEIIINAIDNDTIINYTISIDKNNSNLPDNLKFYTDETYQNEFAINNKEIPLSSDNEIIEKVYWKWNYTEDDESYWNGNNISLVIKVIGEQG